MNCGTVALQHTKHSKLLYVHVGISAFIIKGIDIELLCELDGIVCCPSDRTRLLVGRNHIDRTPNVRQVDNNTPSRAVLIK